MATPIIVKTPITALQFTTIDSSLAATETILQLVKIDLTPAQKKTRLKVAVVRSSEIDDVNTTMVLNNSNSVPSTLDIPTFEADILYLSELKKRQSKMLQQYNEMTKLVEVSQHNLMHKTNEIVVNSRTVAKTDAGVSDAKDALDLKYYTRTKPGPGINHSITPDSTIILSGINQLKPFTNTDKTMLSILNVNGKLSDTIKVYGFITTYLPRDWTNIVVTNLSTTDAGAFELFMK